MVDVQSLQVKVIRFQTERTIHLEHTRERNLVALEGEATHAGYGLVEGDANVYLVLGINDGVCVCFGEVNQTCLVVNLGGFQLFQDDIATIVCPMNELGRRYIKTKGKSNLQVVQMHLINKVVTFLEDNLNLGIKSGIVGKAH